MKRERRGLSTEIVLLGREHTLRRVVRFALHLKTERAAAPKAKEPVIRARLLPRLGLGEMRDAHQGDAMFVGEIFVPAKQRPNLNHAIGVEAANVGRPEAPVDRVYDDEAWLANLAQKFR